MAERTCSVEGCEVAASHRGWCLKHYKRWQRTGTVSDVVTRPCLECGAPFEMPRRRGPKRNWCPDCFRRRRFEQGGGSERRHEWYMDNRDRVLAEQRAAYWADPEAARAKGRSRYTPEYLAQASAQAKAWRAANPARVLENDARKRKGLVEAGIFLVLAVELRRMRHRYRGLCAYCQERPAVELDHVIPVARGGRHSIGNLLPACTRCNRRKQSALLVAARERFDD